MTPARSFAAAGAVLGFLGVAAGAFAAHALRSRLSAESLSIFETAVRNQVYHALALVAVALAYDRWPAPQIAWAGVLFLGGVVVFSGSLYLLVLTGVRWWGAVTPLGGLAFLAGWALLGWGMLRAR
jgi:uncharacterized membrane protein YgdD (TMEM256/DUF423 family)